MEVTMLRKTLVLGLLAISLAAPGTHAQTPPAAKPAPAASAAPAAPAANAVDPAAVQALKDMGAFLQSQKRFHVETRVSGERVLADGQKLQRTAMATMDVDRPDKIRAVMRTATTEREIIYDGKTITLYTPAQKYYSTLAVTATLGDLINKLQEEYAVEMPLADVFLFGTPAAPLDKLESAMNAGQDFIEGELCDHYAYRQGKLDWQIWISAAAGKPLPRKIVITNRADEARPQSVSLIGWNLKPAANAAAFKFTPPKGATKVEVVPRKTK
jgi:hypothetical protein